MLIGSYILHIYCDSCDIGKIPTMNDPLGNEDIPVVYTEKTISICLMRAINDGWHISTKKQLCPICSGAKKGN